MQAQTANDMIYLILTLAAGVAAGFLCRNFKLLKHTGKAIFVTICVMLFFMGVMLGMDEDLLESLSVIGLQAMLLALAGAAGSILFASLLYKSLFREKEKGEDNIR